MPSGKVGFHKNADCAGLFTDHDPEKQFKDLKEIGHGSFGAVYYVSKVFTSENHGTSPQVNLSLITKV